MQHTLMLTLPLNLTLTLSKQLGARTFHRGATERAHAILISEIDISAVGDELRNAAHASGKCCMEQRAAPLVVEDTVVRLGPSVEGIV